jgi:hypothetical protein
MWISLASYLQKSLNLKLDIVWFWLFNGFSAIQVKWSVPKAGFENIQKPPPKFPTLSRNKDFQPAWCNGSRSFFTQENFRAWQNDRIRVIFIPPWLKSPINMLLFILSDLPLHQKLKNSNWISEIISSGGSERTVKDCTKIGKAKDFNTVTFPCIERFNS